MKVHYGSFGNTLCGRQLSDTDISEDIMEIDCKICLKAYPEHIKVLELHERTKDNQVNYWKSGGRGGYVG